MPQRHIELFPNDVLAFIFNILMRDQGHDFINISGDFNVYTGGGDEYMSNLGTIDFAVLKDIEFKIKNNLRDKDLYFTIANTRDSFCYNLLLYVVFNDNEQTIEYNTEEDSPEIIELKLLLSHVCPNINIKDDISFSVKRRHISMDDMVGIQKKLIEYYYNTINCNDDINIFNIIIYIYKCIYNDTSYIYLIGIANLFINIKLDEFIESLNVESTSSILVNAPDSPPFLSIDSDNSDDEYVSVPIPMERQDSKQIKRRHINVTPFPTGSEDDDFFTIGNNYLFLQGEDDKRRMDDDDDDDVGTFQSLTGRIREPLSGRIREQLRRQQLLQQLRHQISKKGGSKNKLEIYKKHINYILGLNNNIQKGGLPPTSSTMKSFTNMLRCFAFNSIGYDMTEYTDGIISIKLKKDQDDPDIKNETLHQQLIDTNYKYNPYFDDRNKVVKLASSQVIPIDRFILPNDYSKAFNPAMINDYHKFEWFDFEKFSLTEHLTKNDSAVENDSFYYLIELLKQSKNGTYNISVPVPSSLSSLSSPPVNINIPALDDLSQISTFIGVDKQIAKYTINATNSINKIKFPIYKYSVLNNDLFRMLSKTFAESIYNTKAALDPSIETPAIYNDDEKEQMKFIVNNESAITMKYGLKFDPNGDDRPHDNVLHNYPTFIDPGSSGSNINQIIDEFGTYEMGFIGRDLLSTSSSSTTQVKQQYTLLMEPRTGEHQITIKVSDDNYSATYIFKKNYTDFFNNGISLNSWNECSAVIALANSFNALQNYYSVFPDILKGGGPPKKKSKQAEKSSQKSIAKISIKPSTKHSNTKLKDDTLPKNFEWDDLYDDYGSVWYEVSSVGKHSGNSGKSLEYLKLTNIITKHISGNVTFPDLKNINFQSKIELVSLHGKTGKPRYRIANNVTLCLDPDSVSPERIDHCNVYWARFPPYFIFYQYSLFKGLGDISQEISTMTKWGGINDPNRVYKTTKTDLTDASEKFNEEPLTLANTNNLYLKYDDYGNAPRCLISHDKASGSRFALLLLAALKCYIIRNTLTLPPLPLQNNINMLCFGGYTGKLIDSLFVKPNMEMVNSGITDPAYRENKVAPFNDILKQITITKKDDDDDEDVNILEEFDAVRYQGGKIKKKTNNKRKKNKTHKRIKNKRNKKTNKRRNKTNKK